MAYDGRGCAVTLCIPGEPEADWAARLRRMKAGHSYVLRRKPIIAVMVQEMASQDAILEEEIPEGTAVTVHVGGDYWAFIERINPTEGFDAPIYLIAEARNREAVQIDYQHALEGDRTRKLKPGECWEINPAVMRHWSLHAKRWE